MQKLITKQKQNKSKYKHVDEYIDIVYENEYVSCTCFKLFDRTQNPYSRSCVFTVEYDNPDFYQSKYPWVIMTQGCDDSSIGWRFSTKKGAIKFFDEMKLDVINNPECFSFVDDFFNYYQQDEFLEVN